MGRKKSERKTVMVRVYEEFAAAVNLGAQERWITAAEFCEQFLAHAVAKARADHAKAEAKRLES